MLARTLPRLLVFTLFALSTSPLLAIPAEIWQSEEAFLAKYGRRAQVVAPGVYEVALSQGETARIAFGARGQAFDRARFEDDLAAARNLHASNPSPSLARHIVSLERLLLGLAADEARAAVTGVLCSSTQIPYPYSLDGYLASGKAFAKASIGLAVDFGPPPPSYPDREAFAYLVTNKGGICRESEASQAITTGAIGIASAASSQTCALGCSGWRSFSSAQDFGCVDSYRSMTRTNGNMNCTYP